MSTLALVAPLEGWLLPLAEVPDPAFAQGLVGDGLAIDPTGDVLHAPCDGTVVFPGAHAHAVALRTADGVEILIHLGIDTIALAGAGFRRLVGEGDAVRAGAPLLCFDLDAVARRAASAVTPIVVAAGGRVLHAAAPGRVRVGDAVMTVALAGAPSVSASAGGPRSSRSLALGLAHGLHARPAAALAAALRPFSAGVQVRAHGRNADARSTIALLALGATHGDRLELVAEGADAEAALDAATQVLGDGVDAQPSRPAQPADAPDAATGPLPARLPGRIASRGLAIGTAVHLDPPRSLHDADADASVGDPAAESDRLARAADAVLAHLDALAVACPPSEREILQAHAAMVRDPALLQHAQSLVARGQGAAAAWRDAVDGAARMLDALDDPHLRARVDDLRDVGQQVLAALAGKPLGARIALPPEAIVIADDLLPSQLLALDRARLAGLAIARGGPTSHVAILAAAMDVPALVALGPQLAQVAGGRKVVLDAEQGSLHTMPDAAQLADWTASRDARLHRRAEDQAAARAPATTRDGVVVIVSANLGGLGEVAPALLAGAEGCGLLRTEFLFLDRRDAPGEGEQAQAYAAIHAGLAPRHTTIRTMDVGGDKPIPYLPMPREDNPALGLRGVRASLAHPHLLRTQLRALLRVPDPARLRILLPMVNDAGELQQVRAMLEHCAQELGLAATPALGVMIETPAAALGAGSLLAHADFASIGSNDLSQYTLAMDRTHARLAAQLDAVHPAVLRLVDAVARAGATHGKPVGLCGGLASDPAAVPLLVGLGVRELSAVPATIPEVKRVVRGLDAGACADLARQAMALPDAAAVRRLLADTFPEPTP